MIQIQINAVILLFLPLSVVLFDFSIEMANREHFYNNGNDDVSRKVVTTNWSSIIIQFNPERYLQSEANKRTHRFYFFMPFSLQFLLSFFRWSFRISTLRQTHAHRIYISQNGKPSNSIQKPQLSPRKIIMVLHQRIHKNTHNTILRFSHRAKVKIKMKTQSQ